MSLRRKPNFLTLLVVLVGTAGVAVYVMFGFSLEPPPEGYKVKSKDVQVISDSVDQAVKMDNKETHKVVESKAVKTDFQFNAIAPHWKETNVSEGNRKLELRTSLDNKTWSAWIGIEAVGPLRDDDPHPERMFAETPLLIDGQYFQYRITLDRDSLQDVSPEIYDLKINHIDSRKPKIMVVKEKIKDLFGNDEAYAAQQHPRVINRSEWGSPDPNGDLFRGTDKYWPTTYKPVKQVFIHHTVTSNYQADPSVAVRAIWDFHANTRGWGDIGYNYLVDYQGNVYQGRLGGDNVVGGHVLGYNSGSIGVALLGCFDSISETCTQLNGEVAAPRSQVLDGLSSLLSNKAISFEIDPWGSNLFCDINNQNCLNLPTITGHRDANDTTCPGNLTVDKLQEIRDATKTKNNEGWTYSAKQLDFDAVDLSNTQSTDVTVRFKNTGTTSWSNTLNKFTLYTMDAPERNSIFQGSGWLSNYQPAVLNEASVSTGGIGSFTFNIKRPNVPPDDYFERYTLITADGSTPGTYFSLPITFSCTIGKTSNPRSNGVLIKEAASDKVYLIENGEKRHIITPLAASTNGLSLAHVYEVGSVEISALNTGAPINIKEGTILKSSNSPSVYIIDETTSGYERRFIPSASVMSTFGLKFDQVQIISQDLLSAYTAGPTLQSSSLVPDGRLVKTADVPTVFLIENGEKRRVTSIEVFNSHYYASNYVGVISSQKLADSVLGNSLYFRTGTLVKTSSSDSVYVIDVAGTTLQKRLITSPDAFNASGFRSELINTISQEAMSIYSNANEVECYK